MVAGCESKMAQTTDIAKLALFLASDDSEILNGAVLPTDFGALSL
jgi:hypothetical protein